MRTTSVPMGPKAFFTTVDPDLGFIADDLAVITPIALALGDWVTSFETLATASLASCRTGQVSGQLDAAGQVSWAYEHGTLRVHAASGFLTTGTGDGGFDLRVRADGSFT